MPILFKFSTKPMFRFYTKYTYSLYFSKGLGWVAYAVITQDLFVLFANAPGLVLSIWLNMGAAKLQYQEMHRNYIYGCGASHSLELQLQHEDEGEHDEENTEINSGSNSEDGGNRIRSLPSFTPHEKWVIRVVTIWVLTLSVVCFVPMSRAKQSDIIGLIVNINLVIFYGAPLSTILDVLKTRNSSSIHRRTMCKFFKQLRTILPSIHLFLQRFLFIYRDELAKLIFLVCVCIDNQRYCHFDSKRMRLFPWNHPASSLYHIPQQH